MFVAKADLVETELSISRVKVRQNSPELRHLIRLYGSRVEKLMYEGGQLIKFLDFDARRTFTSLLAVHWAMLMKMRLNPEVVLNPDGILTRGELFRLRAKHLMGLEGNIPVIPEIHNHH
jgi:phytoene/squalene synthetase